MKNNNPQSRKLSPLTASETYPHKLIAVKSSHLTRPGRWLAVKEAWKQKYWFPRWLSMKSYAKNKFHDKKKKEEMCR